MTTIFGMSLLNIQPMFRSMAKWSCVKWVEGEDGQREFLARAVSRITFAFIIYLVAIVLPGISAIMEVMGSIIGVSINFILPIIFYQRAYWGSEKDQELEHENQNIERFSRDEDFEEKRLLEDKVVD